MSFRKPCLERGCRGYAEPGSSRCALHESLVERDRSRARNERRGKTPVADRLYRALVKAGSAMCAGCGMAYVASHIHVDHRTPLADGGVDTEENIQYLCQWCHREKTAEENRARRQAT